MTRSRSTRAIVFVACLAVLGCTTIPTVVAPDDVKTLAGTWRGWIVTSRDFEPATLEIHPDGTFVMSGARWGIRRDTAGTITTRDGGVRFDGAGGWRGAVSISGTAPHRVLRIDRDDRLHTARFVEVRML